jgi:hypothetical protein
MCWPGPTETLRHAALVVLEVSFLDFFDGGPDFAALTEWMSGAGFVLYDVLGLTYRPLDSALAQADLLFVPHDSPLRASRVNAEPDERARRDAYFRSEHSRREKTLRRFTA